MLFGNPTFGNFPAEEIKFSDKHLKINQKRVNLNVQICLKINIFNVIIKSLVRFRVAAYNQTLCSK